MIQRVLQERLNEFFGCVVRTGAGSFVAFDEVEAPAAMEFTDGRLVFQEPLINGAEFFDVECGVVDPHTLLGCGILEEGEIPQAGEEGVIVQRDGGQWTESVGVEKIATQRL